MLPGLTPFLKKNQIQQIIFRLAREIEKDYADLEELILICPLRGPVFFLSDLIRELKIPIKVDFVWIQNTREDFFYIKKDVFINISGKHVLIVEEIIDSGLSISFLKERLRLSQPASIKTVALLDKASYRKTLIHIDYVGKSIDDRFIVGYGMDLNEEGRNYPDMYHLGQ